MSDTTKEATAGGAAVTLPRTLFERIWSRHVVADLGEGFALLHVDRHVLQDFNGNACCCAVSAWPSATRRATCSFWHMFSISLLNIHIIARSCVFVNVFMLTPVHHPPGPLLIGEN